MGTVVCERNRVDIFCRLSTMHERACHVTATSKSTAAHGQRRRLKTEYSVRFATPNSTTVKGSLNTYPHSPIFSRPY